MARALSVLLCRASVASSSDSENAASGADRHVVKRLQLLLELLFDVQHAAQRTAQVLAVSVIHVQVVVQFVNQGGQISEQIGDFAGVGRAWLGFAVQTLDGEQALARKAKKKIDALRRVLAFSRI